MTDKTTRERATEAALPAVDLGTMTGAGKRITVNGKEYTVKSLRLKDIPAFVEDMLSLDSQLFNFINEDSRKSLDKWLQACVVDENGKPLSLKKATEDDWRLEDLRSTVRYIADLSNF